MNCAKWQTLIMRKIDNETTDIENRDLSIHLNSCSHCRKLNRELEQILTILEDQPSLDLKIDPQLELAVLRKVCSLKYRTSEKVGIIRLAFAGLGLVFTIILLNLGLDLTNFSFFNLFLTINTGLLQITNVLTKLEVFYHILEPFILQELNTLARWMMATYKVTILLSIFLLVRFVYNQRRCITEES